MSAPEYPTFVYTDGDVPNTPNGTGIRVLVLDTQNWEDGNIEELLAGRGEILAEIEKETGIPFGNLDLTSTSSSGDVNANVKVDYVFGHHQFIEDIIRRVSPEANIEQVPVVSSYGLTTDDTVARIINEWLDTSPDACTPGVVNLSLGAYTENDEPPIALTAAIRRLRDLGWIVVASAGNDTTCRKLWPAALPEVIAVGALGPNGPAWFSNYGSWVTACAPGDHIVASIPDPMIPIAAEGVAVPIAVADDEIAKPGAQLVKWSGTSFAAPAVVGAIVREAEGDPDKLEAAVDAVVHNPVLFRLPGLGTVVNVN